MADSTGPPCFSGLQLPPPGWRRGSCHQCLPSTRSMRMFADTVTELSKQVIRLRQVCLRMWLGKRMLKLCSIVPSTHLCLAPKRSRRSRFAARQGHIGGRKSGHVVGKGLSIVWNEIGIRKLNASRHGNNRRLMVWKVISSKGLTLSTRNFSHTHFLQFILNILNSLRVYAWGKGTTHVQSPLISWNQLQILHWNKGSSR